MHNFIIINVNIDRAEGVAQLLDFQGVASDKHLPLLNVIPLLPELKFPCSRVGCGDLLEVPPRLLWCFSLSNIAEHVIMNA